MRILHGGDVLAITLLLAAACREPPPPPAAHHLVLVTLDTLRADHVGVYGGDVETPNLDRLAAEGAFAEEASAHVPLTRPSHVSLMSGRLPPETGVRDNVSPATIPDVPLLAEVLRGAGFDTAAFVSSVVVSRASGLDRGFTVYSDEFDAEPGDPRFLSTARKPGDETVAEAVAWLEERVAASAREVSDFPPRYFLWLHLFDPHDPYEPPEPFASRYPERPYAGEVAWTDELVGRLDAALERLGIDSETLLVVTADHGEGLGDHDELLHGFFVYESTLRVPLIARGPGVEPGTRLGRPVGLVDLYPTVLDLLRIIPPTGTELSGRSLAGALGGGAEPPASPVYAESLVPRLRFGWSELRVVRDGDLKYVRAPRPELYDLAADPGERHNLAGDRRRSVRDLDVALEAFLARERPAAEAGQDLPPELLEKLHALGYLGGSSPASTATPGADPKDKIEDFRVANDLMRRGLELLHASDFGGAREAFGELLGLGIDSAELHLYLGRALLGLGEPREAARHLEEAAGRSPTHAGGWLGLAEARLRLGDADGALEALGDGQAALPKHAGLKKEAGRLLGMLGRYGEAREALEAALPLDPTDALARAMLADVLRTQGDLEGSAARLREAIEIEPEEAKYWNALGMTLGGMGELAEAEPTFREAWRLDPTSHRYAYNLGLALERLGRREEARPFFEKALEIDPGFEPARERLRGVTR